MSKRYGLFVLLVVLVAGVILLALLNSGHLEAPAKPVVTQQSQQARLKQNAKSASSDRLKAADTSAKPRTAPQPATSPTHLTNTGPGSTTLLFLVASSLGYIIYLTYLKRSTNL